MFKLYMLKVRNIHVELCWIPSHIGIKGNEEADEKAKQAAKRPAETIPIYFRDYFVTVKEKIRAWCDHSWQITPNSNKLKQTKK